jgi:hypothetical protein
MEGKPAVHSTPTEPRISRGVRMAESLWAFVDGQAGALGDGGASALIERWVSEKRDAVRRVA